MTSPEPTLTLRALDSLHLFVRELSQHREHYVERLGFRQAGLSGAELQAEQQARASMLESGELRLVLMTPLSDGSDVARFLDTRGDGVGRVVLTVEDAQQARRVLAQRGESPDELCERKVGLGLARWFDLATPFGCQLRFVQYQDCRHVLPGLICRAPRKAAFGSFGVGSLRRLTLALPDRETGLAWLARVLGLSRVSDGTGTVVMRDADSGIELAVCQRATPGVQSLTLEVKNLAQSASNMRAAGAELSATDKGYRLHPTDEGAELLLEQAKGERQERAA